MKSSMRFLLMLAVSAILLAGCGGGNTGDAVAIPQGGGGLSSLADVPMEVVDPSAYGVSSTVNSAINASVNAVKAARGEAGAFSVAGCIAERMKRDVIRQARMPKTILCYMKVLEQKMNMHVGEEAYNYYALTIPGGPSQLRGQVARGVTRDAGGSAGIQSGPVSMEMKIAVGSFGGEVRMAICHQERKVVEFQIAHADGHYVGHMIDAWDFGNGSERNELEFDVDGTPDDYTRATFEKQFDSDAYGFHQMGIEATPAYDIVYGQQQDFWQGNDILRRMYSKFSANEGKAAYDENGTQPARLVSDIRAVDERWYQYLTGPVEMGGRGFSDEDRFCFLDQPPWQELASGESCAVQRGGSENYTIGGASMPLIERYLVATSSAFDGDVSAANLPAPADSAVFAFRTDALSDCSAPAGFTTPRGAITRADVATCLAIEEEQNRWEDEGDCWEASSEAQED